MLGPRRLAGRSRLATLVEVPRPAALGVLACDLDLNVPFLLEAAQREGDQQQADGYEDDGEQAEHGGLNGRVRKARLVAIEPAWGRDRGEDPHQDAEGGCDGQYAAIPAPDVERHE